MIKRADMRRIARARLKDARALLLGRRFDAAVYICGYAVELALKARICRTLGWPGFPETPQELKGTQSVKTHDLKVLLLFSGVERRILAKYSREWRVVEDWTPESRYHLTGRSTARSSRAMIEAATKLVEVL